MVTGHHLAFRAAKFAERDHRLGPLMSLNTIVRTVGTTLVGSLVIIAVWGWTDALFLRSMYHHHLDHQEDIWIVRGGTNL